MNTAVEKEITRLNALIAIQDDEIMHLRERMLLDRGDEGRWLAEARSENARLRHENEQLRKRVTDLEETVSQRIQRAS